MCKIGWNCDVAVLDTCYAPVTPFVKAGCGVGDESEK